MERQPRGFSGCSDRRTISIHFHGTRFWGAVSKADHCAEKQWILKFGMPAVARIFREDSKVFHQSFFIDVIDGRGPGSTIKFLKRMGDPAKLCDVETIGRLAVCKWTIKLCKTRPGLCCVSTKTIVIDALRTSKISGR